MISINLGKSPLVLRLPQRPFIILALIWDKFARVFKGKLPLIRRSLAVYTSEDIVNTRKIQQELGYHSEVSVSEGISRMVNGYRKNKPA